MNQTSNGYPQITFPIAFKDTNYSLHICTSYSKSTDQAYGVITAVTKTGFTAVLAGHTLPQRWIAFGF